MRKESCLKTGNRPNLAQGDRKSNISGLRGYADFAFVPAAPGTFAASTSSL